MNVGSYHQQQQQLLQFNIHQHQPSLPIGSNETDGKMNTTATNVMGPPTNLVMSPVPPSVDQLSQNVNTMSMQDGYVNSPVSSQITDQNKNLAGDDVYNPQKPLNVSHSEQNSTSSLNNYQWNQSHDANAYPNNNILSNDNATFPFNDGSQRSQNNSSLGTRGPSNFPPSKNNLFPTTQNDSFPPAPQLNSFSPIKSFSGPAAQNNSFPPIAKSFTPVISQNDSFSSQNNAFTSPVSQINSFSATPNAATFPPAPQNNSFSPSLNSSFFPPRSQNNFSPVVSAANSFPSSVSQTNSFPPNSAVQDKSFSPQTNVSSTALKTGSFPSSNSQSNNYLPSTTLASSFPPTQNIYTPTVSQSNTFPQPVSKNSFIPMTSQTSNFPSQTKPFSSENSFSSSVNNSTSFPPTSAKAFSSENSFLPAVSTPGSFPPSTTKAFPPTISTSGSFPPSTTNAFPPAVSTPGSYPSSTTSAFPPAVSTPGSFPPSTTKTFPPTASDSGSLPPTGIKTFPPENAFPPAGSAPAPPYPSSVTKPFSSSSSEALSFSSAAGFFPPSTQQVPLNAQSSFSSNQPNAFPPQTKSFTSANSYPTAANNFPTQNKTNQPPSQTNSYAPPSSKLGSFPPQPPGYPQNSQNNSFPPSKPVNSYPPPPNSNAGFPPTVPQEPPSSFASRYPPGIPPIAPNAEMYGTNYNNNNGLPLPPPPSAQYNQKSAYPQSYEYNYGPNSGQADMMRQTAGYNSPYAPLAQQPEPQKRLDPDHIPNPIQVIKEDQELRGNEPFITNQPGLVPPMVSTNFVVEDEGNANPRFIRSTMYYVPCNADTIKQSEVPFSLVITPLATLHPEEQLPPIINTGDIGPIRCVRCKAYVNPHMKFVDGGRRFVCILCKAVTEVPPEYFQHLDHTGQRVDRYDRPELLYGAYEFTVTKEYCKDSEIPNVPALIFVIDVSYNNMKSGMVKLLCEQMADIVQNYMPTDYGSEGSPRMRVGFITYDSTVHFYNIKACLGQPQMMIVGDMDDVFVPILDGFLCDPIESLPVINSLMQQIPATFAETRETDTVLLPAIRAGLEALKAAKCAGKLLVFHSSLPTANVPGKLANREDRKLLGTDKEKTQLSPQNAAYANLAQECVGVGCSVDLFIFNNAHVDLPTIGQISKLTGGEIFKYTYFQADIDGQRFIEDVKRDTSRNIAFDAVMRVRTSTGVRPVNFYGHMFMSNTTDIELASINADKAVAVEIKHDDKLSEEDIVYIQAALLYTSCAGQRRVRILNLSLKSCTQMTEMFRQCELDTIINYLGKTAVTKLTEATPRQVKEGLANKCARILACYRKLCASPCSPGQLILPECMKLLPLYISCLLKSDALSGGSDMTVDDRWYMMQHVLIIDIPSSLNYFYPRMMPLVNIDYYSDELPPTVRCTGYRLSNSEAYLLENGVYMFLWLGSLIPLEWIVNVFGIEDPGQIGSNICKVPVLDNIHSKRINSLIKRIQLERRHTMKLTIVRENDKMEIVFKHFLVEDGAGGAVIGDNLSSTSYVDFLCHMHKEIRNMLS